MAIGKWNEYASNRGRSFQVTELKTTTGAGVWYLVPREVQELSLAIIPSGSSEGKVQFTMADEAIIAEGNDPPAAEILDWPSGAVSSATTDTIKRVSAVRLNVTTGTDGVTMQLTGSGGAA